MQRTFTACRLQDFVVEARHEQVFKTLSLLLRRHSLIRETGKNKQFQMDVGLPGQDVGSQGRLLRGGITWPSWRVNWLGEEDWGKVFQMEGTACARVQEGTRMLREEAGEGSKGI